ncbi:MAG TPA: DUF192 domain-containing protein [Candidatus Acidoferrales bacterium]|nr:DUF192 domain-containing protein [Candidatus Acidoferrales bacterium]
MKLFKTVLTILIIAGLALACAGCTVKIENLTRNKTLPTTYRVTVANTTVYAEAANTPAEWETGLMNRAHLNEDAGMLFIFPIQLQQSLWMKNMRIPLDIVFITADNHVLEIYASVPPCTSDPCPLYTSSAPVKYALEVNSGFCARHGIASDDPVVIAAES